MSGMREDMDMVSVGYQKLMVRWLFRYECPCGQVVNLPYGVGKEDPCDACGGTFEMVDMEPSPEGTLDVEDEMAHCVNV